MSDPFATYDTPDKIISRREAWHENDTDTDPQLDPEDDGETFDAAGIQNIPLAALRQLILFLIPRHPRASKWNQATVRLAIVARILNIDDLGREPLEVLAKQLKVTRSLLSYRQVEIADGFQLGEMRSSKSARARQSYRVSATEAHLRAGHRMTPTAPR